MSVASPVLRPPIPYFGGKQTIAQRVITEMPDHCIPLIEELAAQYDDHHAAHAKDQS